MAADILPFPLHRRRAFVQRHAARMAALPSKSAENHLRRHLDIQTETLAKRGVPPAVTAQEISALETAIRTELWWAVIAPGGTV